MKTFFSSAFNWLKKYYNYVLFVLVAIITYYVIRSNLSFEDLLRVFETANYYYLGLALSFLVIYWILDAVVTWILIRYEYPQSKFRQSFSLAVIGHFYSQVTPSATGGQAMQFVDMIGFGISPGFSTAVLVQKTALYQFAVTLIGILGIFTNWSYVMSWPPLGKTLLFFGTISNGFTTILIILISFKPIFAKKILDFFIILGEKIHIIKDEEKWFNKVDKFVSDYQIAIEGLKERKYTTAFVVILNIIAVAFFFLITYWVLIAMGFTSLSVWQTLMLQGIVYLMFSFIPLPGAAGSAEVGFAIVFGTLLGTAESSAALLTWRFLTFYFILLFGGIYIGIRSLFLGRVKLKTKDELNEGNKESND